MSNSGLECVGSCLQCCSKYQRGEARRGTPPCAAANLPHREGSSRSCAGTGPRRACNPLPRALTPTDPVPLDGGQLPGSRPSRCSAHLCPIPSWHMHGKQLPRAAPAGTQLIPDGRKATYYSISKPAGRTDRSPALLPGQKRHLGGSSPAQGTPSFTLLLSAATTCCSHELKHRDFF